MLDVFVSKLKEYMIDAYLFLISQIGISIGLWPMVVAAQNLAIVRRYDRSWVRAVCRNLIENC